MDTAFDYIRIFRSLPAPHMILDADLRFIAANDAYCEVTLTTREQLLGNYIFDVFPDTEERIALFKPSFERALAGEANVVIRQPFALPLRDQDGGGTKDVVWTCHHIPLHDENGEVCAMLQQAENVTAQVDAEQSRDVVVREFDHRIKNLLAKVTAIARRTATTHTSMDNFLTSFENRIGAMARTQELLVRTKWGDVELAALARDEFIPYLGEKNPRITIEGPDVMIEGRVAQSLGMAFHELATNAAKYGGLSTPGGRVDLTWQKMSEPNQLVIEWLERGLPTLGEAPATAGFGSMIIDQFTPRETGGTVKRTFADNEMRCIITLPEKDIAKAGGE